jgi:phage-related protein
VATGGVLVGRGYVSIRPEFEGDWSNQVGTRAARAGKSGAGAFSKAFSGGLKGLGALAGVAIGANLSSAAAGAAALAPALTTAGAAAGALKLGLSGVGEAFKQAFADSSSQASSAASATRAVESAQRGLANAQRALSQARVDAAKRVKDAQEEVADAERDLADAQRDARDVQGELNDARREAARALQDMNQRLAESHLDEREAVLRLKEAEEELKAAQLKPGVKPEDLEELQIRYERAKLNLTEQRTETNRLAEDTKKANKAGVDGSEQVLSVKERIADANRNVADKERALAAAQAGVDEARADGARQIEDAQRAVADAAAAVADAQAAAAAQASKFDQAMAKLAPNARSFVNAVRGLAPAWTDMRLSVQNRLFEGLDSTVTTLGQTTIPILQRQLTATAGVWNAMAKNAAGAVTEMAKTGMLDQILAGATANLKVFEKAPGQLVTAWGQLAVAAQPAFNALLTQMAGAITSFTDGIAKSFASGGLEEAITTAFGILSQFGTLLGNVLGVVSQIFKAASDAGGQIVGSLAAVFGELRRVLATDEMQAQMRSLFASVAQIVSAIVPIFGAVVQAVVPLLAAIAQPIAQLATVLGPVLQQLATTLGAALLPIVQALGPVLVTVGTAIVQLVQAVTPLLQPIADLISGVINALAPALTPIVNVVSSLVGVLIGPLTQIVQVLTPVLQILGDVITQVFEALEPMLAPLVTLIGQAAQLIANVFAVALAQLMTVLTPLIDVGLLLVETVFAALEPLLPVISEALKAVGSALLSMLPALSGFADAGVALVEGLAPLIPIGVQLVTTVLDALLPVLPTVADAFVAISTALLGIVGPLAEMAGTIAAVLAPILADIAPILGDFVGLLANTLAQVLPPLTTALLSLVTAFAPLLPVFGELVGMVLEMAGGVLVQLLPSLMQLVQAGVSLALALLPILPPLAQLVGLVLELAINVLSWLLPPLLSFAGFLVGQLASALSTAIGWISGIVTAIAGLVSWVTNRLGPAFTWLRDKVVIPAWEGIRGAVATAWGWIKTNVLIPIRTFFTQTVPGWGTTLRTRVVGAWRGMRDGISSSWDWIKQRVLYPIRDFFTKTVPGWGTSLKNKLVEAFDFARKGIKTAWDKIKKIARDPIQYVVDIVYNKGIRGVWNKVATAFGADPLKEFKFARGGIMPGYTPGRDVHRFLSPTGGALELSGGEAIMRPEFTRGAGAGFVNYFNRIAKSHGAQGVKSALAPVFGGNPTTPTDRSLRYANGGVVQRFADGGIFGWIKSAGAAVAGAGSAAWNGIKKGAKWLSDTLEASARAGVTNVVDPLLRNFPGMDTGFGRMIRKIPNRIIDALFGYSKKADEKGAGGIGGPRIQAALRWAKTQNGKPYQWGGNGKPSWDCLTLASVITTPEGHTELRDLHPGMQVMAYQDGKLVSSKVLAKWNTGEQELFKVRTRNRSIRATAGHRVLVAAPLSRPMADTDERVSMARWGTTWKHVRDLTSSDYLVTYTGSPKKGGEEVPEDLAWLMGLWLADGSVHASGGIRICVYSDLAEKAMSVLRQHAPDRKVSHHPRHGVMVSDIQRARWMMRNGFCGKSHERSVPPIVMEWSERAQTAFLNGYADGDGSYKNGGTFGTAQLITYKATSRVLIEGIREMHLRRGDRVTVTRTEARSKDIFIGGKKIQNARPLHSIDATPGRGATQSTGAGHRPGLLRLVEQLRAENMSVQKVLSVEPDGVEETWDIEVEDSHSFVSDGLISHNCSGLVSAIESVIRGQKPHRRWSTHAFSGKTAPPGWVYHGNSAFKVGITNAGVGHTAGTLGKTNVESRGGDGVVIGKGARGYNSRLFGSWYGFQPGKYDAGGWLGPGQVGVNQLRQPEAVLTPGQWQTMTTLADRATDPVVVEIHTRDQALAEFIDVRVHRNNRELVAVLNAS